MPACLMPGGLARRAAVALVVALAGLILATPVRAEAGDNPPPRDPAVEAGIVNELAERSRPAAGVFADATRSLDDGDYEEAEAGFVHVLELAPGFPHASRRLSQASVALGKAGEARRHAYSAYGYDPSPLNIAAVAEALLAIGGDTEGIEALSMARAAARLMPDEAAAQSLHVAAAVGVRDLDAVRQACEAIAADAQGAGGYPIICAALAHASSGEWNIAEELLLGAAGSEIAEADAQWVLDSGIRRRAFLMRGLYGIAWAMVVYVVALFVLVGLGAGLGRMTLAVARRSARSGIAEISASERFMHGAYRVTILGISVYYYVSIPLLGTALVGAWVGAILQARTNQPIPLRIAVIIALIITQYMLSVLYVGLTARVSHPSPGRRLSRSEAPDLWRTLADVAERMGTAPIDTVYVIPDARMSVQEEGRNRELLFGRGRRCLVLGLGLVPNMTTRHLRAVLAHEYAHFTNRDTAGGQIARQVHASMQRISIQLTMVGQNKWYSPGWWYVSSYSRIFMFVTMGASRLHEILADRAAAGVCGVGAFTDALLHIVRQDHLFNYQVRAEMRRAKVEGRPVANLYELPPPERDEEIEALEGRIADAVRRPTSRFDTHLSTAERIELLVPFGTGQECEGEAEPAWLAFADPAALQVEMTDVVRATVRRREDRLLQAVAEAHDEEASRLAVLWRRATWFWRADRPAHDE